LIPTLEAKLAYVEVAKAVHKVSQRRASNRLLLRGGTPVLLAKAIREESLLAKSQQSRGRVVAEGGNPRLVTNGPESLDALLDIPRPWSAADDEADHLLQLVRMQAVTRKRARSAVRGESSLHEKTAEGLLSQVKVQGEDPLCLRLRKECDSGKARNGYELSQDGLLRYKDKVVIPQQKALTQELLYLYHDDQFAGHWGVEKTK
jgi:hypothetical protein